MNGPATPLRDTALLLCDLQNDFIHAEGAYGRGGQADPDIAALPARLAPLARRVRALGGMIVATLFTLPPGRNGEPIIAPPPKPIIAKPVAIPGRSGNQDIKVLTGDT